MHKPFTAALLLLSFALWSQTTTRGAQIHFEQVEIIDTITIAELDTNCMCVAEEHRTSGYTFYFTNTGTEPLVVEFTPSSDPDFNCDFTREPVKPGGKGTVTFCVPPDRLTISRNYTINDNSVEHVTVHLVRYFNYNDSTYRVLAQRRGQRLLETAKADLSHCVNIRRDSLPPEVRSGIDSIALPVITVDTSQNIFHVYNGYYNTCYLANKELPENAPRATVIQYEDTLQYIFCDYRGQVLERWELTQVENRKKDRGHEKPYMVCTLRITEYRNNQPVRVYSRQIEQEAWSHW